MFRKLAWAAMLLMLLSIAVSGMSSQASTCRKVVITIMGQQYTPSPVCWNPPVPDAPAVP